MTHKFLNKSLKKWLPFLSLVFLLAPLLVSAASVVFDWTEQTNSGVRNWTEIASSYDGSKLVAANYNGYIYTSTDRGITWTEQTGSGMHGWIAVTSSSNGTKLAAVDQSPGYIYTSANSGTSWTARTDPGSLQWEDIASSADGTRLIAVAYGAGVFISTDSGASWMEQTDIGTDAWQAVASSADGMDLVVGSGDGTMYISTNGGDTWVENIPEGGGIYSWYGISMSADGSTIVGGVSGQKMRISTNGGSTWRDVEELGYGYWSDPGISADGSIIVAVDDGRAGGDSGYVSTSNDGGATWARNTALGQSSWYGAVVSGDGTLAAISAWGGETNIYTAVPVIAFEPDEFVITVKTDNSGTSDDKSFEIPTVGGRTYNYDVDWGDGSSTTGTTTNAFHRYAAVGTYQIKISGTFPAIKFNFGGDKEKLLSVDHWGTNVWKEMSGAFAGCVNLSFNATDAPDLSDITDLTYALRSTGLSDEDLSDWDVSTVQYFLGTFQDTAFNGDIGDWDMSGAHNIAAMFYNDHVFNQDIHEWDVSNVTDMSSLFAYNYAYNNGGAPLDWGNKTASVQNMSTMFYQAQVFNQNVSDWNVSSVTNMNSMFEGATAFNNSDTSNTHAHPISWGSRTANVTNMQGMFVNNTHFNQDISSWDTSEVTNMSYILSGASLFDQDISTWDVSNVTTLDQALHGVSLSARNYDALLRAWSGQSLESAVPFDVGSSTYCDSASRAILTSVPNSWTITDAGSGCPTVPSVSFGGTTPNNNSALSSSSFDVDLSLDSDQGRYAFLDFDRSLLGWWRFEYAADDSSENDQDGDWNGTETYGLGAFGYAGKFNGSTSFDVTLSSPISSSFTVSAWVKLNSINQGAAIIGDDGGHLLQIGGSDRWQFGDTYSSSAVASTGVWTHLVGVYDADEETETLYVDGVEVSNTNSVRTISTALNIGKRDDNIFIDGSIDEVLLFGRALHEDEIAALYDAETNVYNEAFEGLAAGDHYFTGYVVDEYGRDVATLERRVTTISEESTLPPTRRRSGQGGSVQQRVANLVAAGNIAAAVDLVRQWPNLFLKTPILQTTATATSSVRDLEIGMRGDDVVALQKILISQNKGVAALALSKIGATGYFGTLTKAAVVELQTSIGINPAPGRCGPLTRAELKRLNVPDLWW